VIFSLTNTQFTFIFPKQKMFQNCFLLFLTYFLVLTASTSGMESLGAASISRATIDLLDGARANDLGMVQTAIEQNAEINFNMTVARQTALMISSLHGFTDIVTHLLDQPTIDIHVIEKDGYTCLDGSSYQGRAPIVTALLRAGADPNVKHEDGYYPLHRACWGKEARHEEAVLALLNGGANLKQKASSGQTCLDINPLLRPTLQKFLHDKPKKKT